MRLFFVLGPIVPFPHLFLNFYNFFFARLSQEEFVHLEEGFFQSLLVLFVLVVGVGFEFVGEVPLHEGSHLGTCLT